VRDAEPPPPLAPLGILPPTAKQLAYIAILAKGNRVDVETPESMAEASLLIQRLRAARGLF
jgi:hypothetical protein